MIPSLWLLSRPQLVLHVPHGQVKACAGVCVCVVREHACGVQLGRCVESSVEKSRFFFPRPCGSRPTHFVWEGDALHRILGDIAAPALRTTQRFHDGSLTSGLSIGSRKNHNPCVRERTRDFVTIHEISSPSRIHSCGTRGYLLLQDNQNLFLDGPHPPRPPRRRLAEDMYVFPLRSFFFSFQKATTIPQVQLEQNNSREWQERVILHVEALPGIQVGASGVGEQGTRGWHIQPELKLGKVLEPSFASTNTRV